MVRKKQKTPLERVLAGFSRDSNSKPKAVHFDITKKSIIFVLIELYSIAILGEFLYGFWGLNRYEMYRFVPTFYWTYNRLPYGKNNLSLFEKGRNRPGQISATDWG